MLWPLDSLAARLPTCAVRRTAGQHPRGWGWLPGGTAAYRPMQQTIRRKADTGQPRPGRLFNLSCIRHKSHVCHSHWGLYDKSGSGQHAERARRRAGTPGQEAPARQALHPQAADTCRHRLAQQCLAIPGTAGGLVWPLPYLVWQSGLTEANGSGSPTERTGLALGETGQPQSDPGPALPSCCPGGRLGGRNSGLPAQGSSFCQKTNQVRRQRFLLQGLASGLWGLGGDADGVRLLQFMLRTQPSLSRSTCLRPGGRGRPSRVSPESGRNWRRREQHRYCREVALAQARITFMLLRAAVEHTIG